MKRIHGRNSYLGVVWKKRNRAAQEGDYMHHQVRLFVLCSVVFLCAAMLGALDVSDLTGAWYRVNPSNDKGRNSVFRAEVYSFSPGEASSIKAYIASLYPSPDIRTRIVSGSVTLLFQAPNSINAIFRQKRLTVANRLGQAKGWPVASVLDMPGTTEIHKEVTIAIQEGPAPETLLIDGKEYRSVSYELRQRARGADTEENAIAFLRLSYLMIYFFQARVPGFATGAMIGINNDVPGLHTGSLHMEFTPRGALGLGNSGVQFTLRESSDIPGILASGNIFAGVFEMEGVLSFYEEHGSSDSFLGSIDFTKVKANNGVFVGGVLQVMLASGRQTRHYHQLPYTAVPD